MLSLNLSTHKRDFGTGVSCEFWKIFKNRFLYRTPRVAAYVIIAGKNKLNSEKKKKKKEIIHNRNKWCAN